MAFDRVKWQREYHQKHKSKRLAYDAQYKKDHPEKNAAWQKKYVQNNRGKVNALQAKRKAMKLRQTPSWYCDWMVKEIYEACPEGMQVDHIQALSKGGLHSHENLQYLTIAENLSKGNSERGR